MSIIALAKQAENLASSPAKDTLPSKTILTMTFWKRYHVNCNVNSKFPPDHIQLLSGAVERAIGDLLKMATRWQQDGLAMSSR